MNARFLSSRRAARLVVPVAAPIALALVLSWIVQPAAAIPDHTIVIVIDNPPRDTEPLEENYRANTHVIRPAERPTKPSVAVERPPAVATIELWRLVLRALLAFQVR